jgi:hypothetical protein
MKPENSLQIFKKYSYFKVHKNPSSGSQDVPYAQKDGHTDSHDKTKSCILQFCKCSSKENSHSQNSSILIVRGNSGLKSLTLTDILLTPWQTELSIKDRQEDRITVQDRQEKICLQT